MPDAQPAREHPTRSTLLLLGTLTACGALASMLAGRLHDGTPLPMAAIMASALTLSALALFGLAQPVARA